MRARKARARTHAPIRAYARTHARRARTRVCRSRMRASRGSLRRARRSATSTSSTAASSATAGCARSCPGVSTTLATRGGVGLRPVRRPCLHVTFDGLQRGFASMFASWFGCCTRCNRICNRCEDGCNRVATVPPELVGAGRWFSMMPGLLGAGPGCAR
jgi:hypothetical protein